MAGIPINSAGFSNFAISVRRQQPSRPAGLREDGRPELSLENQVELSHKANVAPPPPPSKKVEKSTTTRVPKGGEATKSEAPQEQRVQTTDNCGRIVSGSLHGPLLMEEAGISYTSAAAFSSEGFRYDNPLDFDNLKEASKALATLNGADDIHSMADPGYLYVGTINGFANLAKDEPDLGPAALGGGAIVFPDGRVGHISRSARNGGEIRVRVPEDSLDLLADWGRRLLAIA